MYRSLLSVPSALKTEDLARVYSYSGARRLMQLSIWSTDKKYSIDHIRRRAALDGM